NLDSVQLKNRNNKITCSRHNVRRTFGGSKAQIPRVIEKLRIEDTTPRVIEKLPTNYPNLLKSDNFP
ncbi:MAG: hypothetical protein P8Y45_17420, partial [Exilibacterium sp.]